MHIVGQAGDRSKALTMCYSDVFFALCVDIPHIIFALLNFLQNFSRLLARCDSVVEAGHERRIWNQFDSTQPEGKRRDVNGSPSLSMSTVSRRESPKLNYSLVNSRLKCSTQSCVSWPGFGILLNRLRNRRFHPDRKTFFAFCQTKKSKMKKMRKK